MDTELRNGEAHPSDGDLIRMLDGEPTSEVLDEHVASCQRCATRLTRFGLWSRELTEVLESADPIVGEGGTSVIDAEFREREDSSSWHRRVPRRFGIAAGIVLMLVSLMAVPPVRAWITETTDRAFTAVRELVAPAATSSDGSGPVTVSFAPSGERLVIEIDHVQTAGELVVTVSDGSEEVRASSSGHASGEAPSFAVLPSQLRIRNPAGATIDYRVRIPTSVEEVEVRVADSRLALLEASDLRSGREWVWGLSEQRGD